MVAVVPPVSWAPPVPAEPPVPIAECGSPGFFDPVEQATNAKAQIKLIEGVQRDFLKYWRQFALGILADMLASSLADSQTNGKVNSGAFALSEKGNGCCAGSP